MKPKTEKGLKGYVRRMDRQRAARAGLITLATPTRPELVADEARWRSARLAEARAWRERNNDWLTPVGHRENLQ